MLVDVVVLLLLFWETWELAGVAADCSEVKDTSGPTTVLLPLPWDGSVAVTSTPLAFSKGEEEEAPPAGPVAEGLTEVEDPVLEGMNEMTVVWAVPVAVAPVGLTEVWERSELGALEAPVSEGRFEAVPPVPVCERAPPG